LFVGHFGVGLAAKKLAPRVSLGTLLLSVQFADLLWPVLLLLGIEHVRIVFGLMKASTLDLYDYPVSHSLTALAGWAVAFAVVYFFLRRDRAAAFLLAAGVLSHWVLDFVMHRPDMPILPRGPYVGLGLWESLPATLAIEGVFYAAGISIYLRTTRPKDRIGIYALWIFLILLAVTWLASLLGPPPPDERTLAWSGMIAWLLVPWAYWIDRHRIVRPRVNAEG
jgi:cell shape-determining protein MreD